MAEICEEFIPEINIISKEDFKPSTMTIKGILSDKLNINILPDFLIVSHKFDEENNRLKKPSGSRRRIEYFGKEGELVSVCYKDIRRGIRTGAMNNMITSDIQILGSNIHLKISKQTITSVGTSNIKSGKIVVEKVINMIKKLKDNLDYSNRMSVTEKQKCNQWLDENLPKLDQNIRYQELISLIDIPKDIDNTFVQFVLCYWDDFDDYESFRNKINKLDEKLILYEGDISCAKYDIFNSVYHIQSIKNSHFRMPLHKLAPYLAQIGVQVEFHNWTSEGVNMCFDIEEVKEGLNHSDKDYKHRFTIHETTKIRQCSPTSKEEAYTNYLGVMNILKKFFTLKDIDYKKYIEESWTA